jgi:hypothetical protein
MRTSSPSQLIIEAYDEESSVVDVYVKIHDATTNLFFNGTGWQDSEAWLFCTSDINDQWYLDTDWSDEPNHTYHITAEAYDECGNIGTDMHTFTIIAEELTFSISGTIYYTGEENGTLTIALFDQNPEDINVTPIVTMDVNESYEFPVGYTFNNVSDYAAYYVAAHIDMNDNGGPPDADEPQGWAINKTMWLESPDPLPIVGANFTDADVTLAIPPMNKAPVVDITYPEDDDWFNYSDVGALTITGIAYDQDTYVDEVQVMLTYTDEQADTYYYNMSGWSLIPYSFSVGGTGAGTMADPLVWELTIEPGFPIVYYLYDVYATVFDHDAIPLSNSDANWFWYPELPLENNAPNIPTNLEPSNGLTNGSIDMNLYWTGGDPDAGDTVSYEIHFGTDPNPSAITTVGPYDNTKTTREYDLGTLDYNTQYFWYIIAIDNHNASSSGPIWNFTTGQESLQTIMGITLSSDKVNVGENFTATVYLDPTQAVGGWEIYLLTFDPALAQANSVESGAVWATFFDGGTINNGIGEITEIQSFKTDTYPDSNHTLCTINFTALSAGTCTFALATVEVTDTSFVVMPVTTRTATISIITD